MKVALDTNILIYFLEGIEPWATKAEKLFNSFMKSEKEGVFSTISVAETLTGIYLTKDDFIAGRVKEFLGDMTLNAFQIIPVTLEIADLAASLRAKRGGKLPDALIVATAICNKAEILYSQDEDLKRYSQEIKVSEMD